MKLNCKHVWEHISEYIEGSVDAKLREDIERHLEHCEICSAILDSTRNILVLTAMTGRLNCRWGTARDCTSV